VYNLYSSSGVGLTGCTSRSGDIAEASAIIRSLLFSVGTRPMKRSVRPFRIAGMFTIPHGQAKLYVLAGQAGLLKDLVYATETTRHWAERSLSVAPQTALYRRKITDAVADRF
jgi:hypothetical protein